MSLRISSIHYYPIKSCAGISLDSAEIGPRGIKYDREWMIVDGQGKFLSQRELPRLSLIQVFPDASGNLELAAPQMPVLKLKRITQGPELQVKVWNDYCLSVDQGKEASSWLEQFLQYPCRLVRMKEDFFRPVDPEYVSEEKHPVGFADGFPFLLISEASLLDLNSRLEFPILMNRFRPNLVVSGAEPFAEDTWKEIAINGLKFQVAKPCARCVITTIDQEQGVLCKEPLRTLASYRKIDGKVLFGQNLVHNETGKIGLGDFVEVLS